MTHGQPLDVSNEMNFRHDIDLALLDLHERLKARNAPKPDQIRLLPAEARRAYDAAKRRESRARAKTALEQGKPKPHRATVRDGLADAALMLLATGGPGAEQVRHVLHQVFADKPAVVMAIERRIRAGKIKPKLVRVG